MKSHLQLSLDDWGSHNGLKGTEDPSGSHPGVQMIEETANSLQSINLLARCQPNMVLMDLVMAFRGGDWGAAIVGD